MPTPTVAYAEALALILGRLHALAPVKRSLVDCLEAIAAEDVLAQVDAPSAAVSLRDGYALRAADVLGACRQTPVTLAVGGVAAAGDRFQAVLCAGSALRILTGGRIPLGADAVVAEEDARIDNTGLVIEAPLAAGQHILAQGTDVRAGEVVVRSGERLNPERLGLLAAAGLFRVGIRPMPRVAIIAVGDEIRLPGASLAAGQLYASNAVTLQAWCRRWRCETVVTLVPDRQEAILAALREALTSCDMVLTSGGAWLGDRDLVRPALETLGWQAFFPGVRLSPGKGTGFGLVDRCPVTVLSGGPPANFAGFLKLALPAILKMGGHGNDALPRESVRLRDAVRGWRNGTRVVWGRLRTDGDGRRQFAVDRRTSRLKAMARAEALLTIPEGAAGMAAGGRVTVECLA